MSEWQPIESAPKDGSAFIGLTASGRATTMRYVNSVKGWVKKPDGGYIPDGYHMVLCEEDNDSICPRTAKGWMPLPPAQKE